MTFLKEFFLKHFKTIAWICIILVVYFFSDAIIQNIRESIVDRKGYENTIDNLEAERAKLKASNDVLSIRIDSLDVAKAGKIKELNSTIDKLQSDKKNYENNYHEIEDQSVTEDVNDIKSFLGTYNINN